MEKAVATTLRFPDYKVKGAVLASKIKAVEGLFGAAALAELKTDFAERLRFPIIDLLWYPYEQLEALLLEIVALHFDGRLESLTTLGERSAQHLLTTVYWAYAREGSFKSFMASAQGLHNRFYSHGIMRAEIAEGDRSEVVVHLEGAPYYSRADLYVATGFYLGASHLLGNKYTSYDIERRDDGASVTLRW